MIAFDKLGDMIRRDYSSAEANGWNVETQIIPDDGASPVLIISVVQPNSMVDWVGLRDDELDAGDSQPG